jgi:hypothetical protein
MNNAELTLENVVKLAEKIAAECNIPMQDAMDLAEFKLRYAGGAK